jgi:hypothetical protein
VPVPGDCCHHRVDLLVGADVQGIGHFRAQFGSHALDTGFQLVVLVGEREFGALARERLRNAPCNRAIACKTNDQRTFARHEPHVFS